MNTTTVAVACTDIHLHYGRKVALAGLSLSVLPGSVYALLGRNGAGKSSLVRCLLGQRRPDGGTAHLLGHDVWRHRADLMSRIGVVPEEPDAPPEMSAEALSRFCAELYPHWHEAEVMERLSRFGVPTDQPCCQLSRGQKTQLSLALALGHHPELLVMDDPTLGLDAAARRAFYQEVVADLADRNTTIFITTHDLAGIEGLATHVGIVNQGRLVVDEAMEALKARFRMLRGHPDDLGADLLTRFAPIHVNAQPWGTEALVAGFDEGLFEHLRQNARGEIQAAPLSLEDLFIACSGSDLEVCR